MLRLHRLPSHKLPIAPRVLRLRVTTMLRPQSLQQGLDRPRQPRVRRRLRHPSSITARLRDGEQRQDRDARRLVLVRDVRVVPDRGEFVALAAVAVLVVGAEVDVVQFEVVFDVCSDGLVAALVSMACD